MGQQKLELAGWRSEATIAPSLRALPARLGGRDCMDAAPRMRLYNLNQIYANA